MPFMRVSPGLTATVNLSVRQADSAISLGSGDVPVLATPRLVALVEQAAVAAVAESLPAGSTTVGTNVTIDHLAATAIGDEVAASATVVAVDGRRVSFSIEAHEGDKLIARGTHSRAIVDRDRFLASLTEDPTP